MTLPKIDLPLHKLRLPSSGKEITVRPFLVKEEKLLLMAQESGSESDIITTVKQIINNCIVGDNIRIDSLPFFDVDYLFIALRAKSIGESIDIKYRCNNIVGESECGNVFPAKIDISNCKVIKNEAISNEISISGTVRVKMKYPTYSIMKNIMDNDNILNKKIQVVVGSIEYIKEKEKIYGPKDVSKEELVQFIEGLTQEQFKKFESFIDNFPTFVVTSEAACGKCGFVHHLEYKDFTSFFV
jgi:hypothetical protein